jgi:hypothetical protein
MYTVSWKRLSDGALIPAGTYGTLEEAVAEAQEPVSVPPESVAVVVTDPQGALVFSTADDFLIESKQ